MGYFARVTDPKTLRVAMLEASREIVILLKQQKQFSEIRDEKREKIESLKKDLKEIVDLAKKVEDFLPHREIKDEIVKDRERLALQAKMLEKRSIEENARRKKEEEKKLFEMKKQEELKSKDSKKKKIELPKSLPEVKKIIPVQKESLKKIAVPKDLEGNPVTDLDRLEYTLSKIESKLKELNK